MDTFTRSYIRTALWAETDNSNDQGGLPLDQNYDLGDIAPETLARMVADCEAFQRDNAADITGNLPRAGHDFWLTRNGHGAGFWDGDWPEGTGERLTAASSAYGFFDLFVDENGMIHG